MRLQGFQGTRDSLRAAWYEEYKRLFPRWEGEAPAELSQEAELGLLGKLGRSLALPLL